MKQEQKTAVIISIILFLLVLGSIAMIFSRQQAAGSYVADIYQNGSLINSISLYDVKETYTLEIKGDNGCSNVIEIAPGSIAIIAADCPDRLCVHQGAVTTSLLPITCLPNRVVIQLREVKSESVGNSSSITPDIITH